MKPTQEQVIAWAREICGSEMLEWRDGTEMEWHEFHALALRCYEAGRKDENDECAKVCDKEAEDNGNSEEWVYHTATGLAASIRARREQ